MPRYKIYADYGVAGYQVEEEIEADNEAQAEQMAWEMAVERVNSWVDEITEEEESDGV
jgi:hypothetical protein